MDIEKGDIIEQTLLARIAHTTHILNRLTYSKIEKEKVAWRRGQEVVIHKLYGKVEEFERQWDIGLSMHVRRNM